MRIPAERICIVRISHIGDVVNAMPFANSLRAGYPNAFIAWVVGPVASPLLKGHPAVNEVLVYDRHVRGAERKAFWKRIAGYHFDLTIDLQKLWKSGQVTRHTRAPNRLGFDFWRSKEGNWLFSNLKIPRGDPQSHAIDQNLEFLDFLDIPREPVEWNMEETPDEAARADAFFAEHGLKDQNTAVLNIGATEEAKMWYPEYFARLAKLLHERYGLKIILTGGPDPRERQFGSEVLEGATVPIVDTVGTASLRELIGILKRSKLVVSSDTGPLHMAAGLHVPTVGLFGAQNPRRTGPYGFVKYTAVKDLPCSPCFKKRCILRKRRCMRELKPGDVIGRVEEMEWMRS